MSDEDTLKTAIADWFDAFNRKDVEACTNLYTEDATILVPDTETVKGHDAIRELHKDWLTAGEKNKRFKILEIGVSGDLAFVMNLFLGDVESDDGSVETRTGRVVNVYKQQSDGTWKTQITTINW